MLVIANWFLKNLKYNSIISLRKRLSYCKFIIDKYFYVNKF